MGPLKGLLLLLIISSALEEEVATSGAAMARNLMVRWFLESRYANSATGLDPEKLPGDIKYTETKRGRYGEWNGFGKLLSACRQECDL